MQSKPKSQEESARPALSAVQKGVLVLLALLFLGSVAVRAMKDSGPDATPTSGAASKPALAPDGFLPGLPGGTGTSAPAEPAEQPGGIEGLLPLFTEGSFFALIGFALGYASRKVVKLLLIFVAIFFLGIQALSYAEVMTVDWNHAIELLNRVVLNLKEDQPFTQVLKEKIPTVGALIAGYFLGFRRG